jgi:hypothetical protein
MLDRLLVLLRHPDPIIRQQGRELARSLPPPMPPDIAFYLQLDVLITWLRQLRDRTEQAPPVLQLTRAQLHRVPVQLRFLCDQNWWQVGAHQHGSDESRLTFHIFCDTPFPRRPSRRLTLIASDGPLRVVLEERP